MWHFRWARGGKIDAIVYVEISTVCMVLPMRGVSVQCVAKCEARAF